MWKESAISITGITPSAHCCQCRPENVSDACFADTVVLACADPDIKKILSGCVSVTLVEFKVLCTAAGKKLVITFLENSTITYTAANCLATKHKANFCLPRCMALTLETDCPVKTVHLCVEDFTVIPLSLRTIGVTSLITAFPEFRHQRTDEEGSLRYDIKIRSRP